MTSHHLDNIFTVIYYFSFIFFIFPPWLSLQNTEDYDQLSV